MVAKRFWLMKSEEDVFSIRDLEEEGTTSWEGVRNYEARNIMRDEMKKGDEVLFYHSNAMPPGVAGVARVEREGYPDSFAFEKGHRYFDAKSDPASPRWYMVDVSFQEAFAAPVTLQEIRDDPALADMVLVQRPRLSVQPVTRKQFERIRALGRGKVRGD